MGQRPKSLTPHQSPQHYWGAELRTWREKRGLSVAALGRELHLNGSYIAKIERGERTPRQDLAESCDRVLDTDGSLLRLHALVSETGEQRVVNPPNSGDHVASSSVDVANQSSLMAAQEDHQAPLESGDNVTVPARSPNGKVILVSIPRRLFLQGLGGAAVGLAAGDHLQDPPARVTKLPSPDVALPHFEQMRRTMADSDNLFGPHQVIPAVQQQLWLMQQITPPTAVTERQQWMRVQTEFADLAGWLHQDSGNHLLARHWLDRSLEWGYQTGDADDVVFILARKAQLALDMHNPAEAVGLGEAAIRMSRPRSRLAAIAAVFAGHGSALNGDNANSGRAYDRARELLANADADQTPWADFFDINYVTVWEAASLTQLGNYAAATAEYERAIAALPPGLRRDSGLYLARKAVAYAGAGERDQAVAVGLEALEIGAETGSGRILNELATLDTTLMQRPTKAGAQFHDALAASLPQQLQPREGTPS